MLSLATVSQAQGATYYSKENYYSKDNGLDNSRWGGRGAASFQLSGRVGFNEFDNLLKGLSIDGSRFLANDLSNSLGAQNLNIFARSLSTVIRSSLLENEYFVNDRRRLEEATDGLTLTATKSLNGRLQTAKETNSSVKSLVKEILLLQKYSPAPLKVGPHFEAEQAAHNKSKSHEALTIGLKKAYAHVNINTLRNSSKFTPAARDQLLTNLKDRLDASLLSIEQKDKLFSVLLEGIGKIKNTAHKNKALTAKALSVLNGSALSKIDLIHLRKVIEFELLSIRDKPERVAATDLTFSSSKSVSIQALIFDDKRLIDAHNAAVDEALSFVESKYSTYRVGSKGERSVETSGKLTIAQFLHESSRKKDAQLHTHAVVLNLVETSPEDGKQTKFKALFNKPLYRDSKLIGMVYQNNMAQRALALGYSVTDNGRGSMGLAGFTAEQEQALSKRSMDLKVLGATNQREARSKVLIDRPSKGPEVTREELSAIWLEEAEELGLTGITPSPMPVILPKRSISKALDSAIAQVSERKVSFRKEDILSALLENNLGFFSFDCISKVVDSSIGKKIFSSKESGRYVSLESLRVEKSYRSIAQSQISAHKAFMNSEKASDIVANIVSESKAQGQTMTEGQKNVIRDTLTSRDGLIIWQGVAGAGKTAALRPLVEVLTAEGYNVQGYAPSASAAKQLSEGADISADTLEALLLKGVNPDQKHEKTVIIIDEASFISARDMERLFNLQIKENLRIVLSGDTRQKHSVGAGSPFRDLQNNVPGLTKTDMNVSVRQRDPLLIKAVALMNKDDVPGGLRLLHDKIVEVVDSERSQAVASFYLSLHPRERDKSIVVARTNLERKDITARIQEGLKLEGVLGKSVLIKVYEKVDLPRERLKVSSAAEVGDILVPNRNVRLTELHKNRGYEILERDTKNNILYLKEADTADNGKRFKLDLNHFNEHSLFKARDLKIYESDKLAWSRNQKGEGRLNNDFFKVKSIGDGEAEIEYQSGKKEFIDTNKRHFIDQATVITTDKSQGMSKWRNIVSVDRGKTKNDLYVDTTRAVGEIRFFVSSRESLYRQAALSGSNKIASEMVNDRQLVEDKLKQTFPDLVMKQRLDGTRMVSLDRRELLGNQSNISSRDLNSHHELFNDQPRSKDKNKGKDRTPGF